MFKKDDLVVNIYTGIKAIVRHVDNEELMTVKFKDTKFRKGNLNPMSQQVLIKQYKLLEA